MFLSDFQKIFQKSQIIRTICEDSVPSVPPAHHMICCPRVPDSLFSRQTVPSFSFPFIEVSAARYPRTRSLCAFSNVLKPDTSSPVSVPTSTTKYIWFFARLAAGSTPDKSQCGDTSSALHIARILSDDGLVLFFFHSLIVL